MRGTLKLNNIAVECIIGLNPKERVAPQRIRLDVEISVDFLPSQHQKDTAHTVDWSRLPGDLAQFLRQEQFYLAETACVALVRKILSAGNAFAACVTLTKLEAHTGAETVSATFEATRAELHA